MPPVATWSRLKNSMAQIAIRNGVCVAIMRMFRLLNMRARFVRAMLSNASMYMYVSTLNKHAFADQQCEERKYTQENRILRRAQRFILAYQPATFTYAFVYVAVFQS